VIQQSSGVDGRRLVMADEPRVLITTEYFLTAAEYIPSGVEYPPSPTPEDNPWYVLHTRAEAVRAAWWQAFGRIKSDGAPTDLVRHVESGLFEADEQLRVIEALGIVGSADARVFSQARDTLEGLASATARLASKNDPDLLASWLAGQGVQLRARLEGWSPRLTPTGMDSPPGMMVVYSPRLGDDFTGGWVA